MSSDIFDRIYNSVFNNKVPTLFLGSGSSITTGIELNLKDNFPSMSFLAKQYHEIIKPCEDWEEADELFWKKFVQEIENINSDWEVFNLEKFLTENPLYENSNIIEELLFITADAFHSPQQELQLKLSTKSSSDYSIKQLLEKLLIFLNSNNPSIDIITPNYDLVIEYTADLLGVPCLNGFHGNVFRYWKPEIGFATPLMSRGKLEAAKHIKLYKPHGSYSWFINENHEVLECYSGQVNKSWKRCMIAPGPNKYQNALKDVRRDHLKYMDEAFDRAQSIFVIGYGLNDPHLQEGLKKCLNKRVPILIVTKELSEEAKDEFIKNRMNVFAILEDGNGSVVINGNKEFQFKEQYWKLNELNAKLIN